MNLKDLYAKRPLLTVFVICLICISGIAAFLPIRFEENDDIVMLLISSGVFFGEPNEHLVFINVILGFVLKFLYEYIPNIEHYTVLFLLIHIFSSSVIINFILKLQNQHLHKLLFLLLFAAFELKILLTLQFTTTSAILATASIIYLIDNHNSKKWFGVLLFIFAFCIRYNAAMLVLIVSIPLFFINSFSFPFNLSFTTKEKRSILIYATLIAMISSLYFYDKNNYNQQPEWKYYKEYNAFRGQINDNHNASKLNEVAAVNKNDYALLLNFFPDPSVIDLNKISSISKQIDNTPLTQKIKNIGPQLMRHLLILIILFMLLLMAFLPAHKRQKYLLAVMFSLHLFVLCTISLNGSLKTRVLIVSIMPILFIALPIWFKNIKKWGYRLSLILMSVLVLIILIQQINVIISVKKSKEKVFSEQMQLLIDHKIASNKGLITFSNDFRVEYVSPLHVSSTYKPFMVGFGGWLTSIPFNQQLKTFEEFIDTKSLFIRNENIETVVPRIIESLRVNKNKNVSYRILLQSANYAIIDFFEVGR